MVTFHNYINSLYVAGHFSGWWHNLLGPQYIVTTRLNENQIYNLLRLRVNNNYFLVVKIDPTSAQGWLPKKGWKWLGR